MGEFQSRDTTSQAAVEQQAQGNLTPTVSDATTLTQEDIELLKNFVELLKEDRARQQVQNTQLSKETTISSQDTTQQSPEEKEETSWWMNVLSWLAGLFLNSDSDDIIYQDNSHNLLSIALVWACVLALSGFLFCMSYFMYELVLAVPKENLLVFALDKTPFVFVAVIFCAALMFLDSLIKTLKYKSRPQENIISLIIKNVGILMLLWYMMSK